MQSHEIDYTIIGGTVDMIVSFIITVRLALPAVLVATGRMHPRISAVSIDDYQGAVTMTRHLLNLGQREPLMINLN